MNIFRILQIFLVAILFSGCKPETSQPKAQSAEAWCMAEVKNNLKDPESANFKEISANRGKTNDLDECSGMVNAKNSMGGYVGFKKFFRYPDGSVSFGD